MLSNFIEQYQLPASFEQTARLHFMPLAKQLTDKVTNSPKPFFLGINGCQGSGKSTLASFLFHYLTEQAQLSVVNLSLDDFYFDQITRQQLASDIHPLLATRGVPGTHDITLLAKTLHALKTGKQTLLPSFNKAQDNPAPKTDWLESPGNTDVVIFEGWCWGVTAQAMAELASAINSLEAKSDATATWRNYVNEQLASYYQPLYPLVDSWLMLKAPSFDCVAQWRWQQEQKLAAQQAIVNTKETANKVMSKPQVMDFIAYFQRLTEHALATLPERCDLVFELDQERNINATVGRI
ncbi:P-loop NTPase fold protein [Thalassotalea montiporae]